MVNTWALRVFVALTTFGQMIDSKVKDEEGQTLAEYGLIMAVIAVAVVVGAGILFRDAIVGAFNKSTNCLNGGGGCS